MPVTELTVTTLGELVDRVTPSAPDPVTGRHRDAGVYHGAADACTPLLTSLDRLGGAHPPHTKADLEEHILRNFIRYSRPHLATEPANDWELLVAAQHHGVPTRLLDWTYSPLIAAFFATRPVHQRSSTSSKGQEHDRAIWRLDWQAVHKAFNLPPLALLTKEVTTLGKDDAEEFTPWRLFARKDDSPPFACMIEPPSLNDRIVAQAATFTLCSTKTISFDQFLEQHDLSHALTKFIIPAEHVPRVRDQLDLVSVDERRLFPDLDGVATGLRRYYA